MAITPSEFKQGILQTNVKPITEPREKKSSAGERLFEIGRSTQFREDVDPEERLGRYIRSKMHVIDIIPCDYEIPLIRSTESGKIDAIDSITPKVIYSERIRQYKELCLIHGLFETFDEGFAGIRLFITDETQMRESIDTAYEDSMFQPILDQLSSRLREMRGYARSASSRVDNFIEEINETISTGAGTVTRAAAGLTGANEADANAFANNISAITKTLGNVVGKGNRVSMPKIWSNTTYGQELNCFIKLVSPYGSPTSIANYIIKPLMYILVLASPRTSDNVSYGGTMPVTIRAYGLANYNVATIRSIGLRRGGSDTSFNIYRQPLTVDVRMTFQNLVEGFAVFDLDNPEPSTGIFRSASEFIGHGVPHDEQQNAMMTNIKTFVNSMRPVRFGEIGNRKQIENLGHFDDSERPRFPIAIDNEPELVNSVFDEALRKIKKLFPDLDFPDNLTPRELLDFVLSIKAKGGTAIFRDLKTKLQSILRSEVADPKAALLDLIREVAGGRAADHAKRFANNTERSTIRGIIKKLPDFDDFTF